MRELFHKFSSEYKNIAFKFPIVFLKLMIYAQNKHNLICEVGFSYHEMSPKSNVRFWVVCRKSGLSRIFVHFLENSINFIICEHTEITIDNPVELSLGMESESECVVDSFFFRNIFPPRKFYFISISIDFWRCNNWVEYRRLSLYSNSNSWDDCSSIEYFLI